jgi:hypothetical protein
VGETKTKNLLGCRFATLKRGAEPIAEIFERRRERVERDRPRFGRHDDG